MRIYRIPLIAVVLCVPLSGAPLQAQLLHNPWEEVRSLPREFASDAWAVLTAPVRLDRSGAIEMGAVLGVGALLFAFDGQITDAVQRNRSVEFLDAVEDVGDVIEPLGLMGNTNKYFVAAWFAGAVLGSDRLVKISKELFFSHWLAGASRKIVGYPIGRMRPENGFGPYEFRPGKGSAFPSGHASTIVQLATVLSHHIDHPVATVALHGTAATLLYQRVASGKHWASETVIGAAWGYAIARIVIDRREADRKDFVSVSLTPDGIQVSIPVAFGH